eukprot:scaffold120882_cov27-Phaeocystis_antarctica.AAC.1
MSSPGHPGKGRAMCASNVRSSPLGADTVCKSPGTALPTRSHCARIVFSQPHEITAPDRRLTALYETMFGST